MGCEAGLIKGIIYELMIFVIDRIGLTLLRARFLINDACSHPPPKKKEGLTNFLKTCS